MSKMSQLHMELEERAADLGFKSIEETQEAGYNINWVDCVFVPCEKEEILHDLDKIICRTREKWRRRTLRRVKGFIQREIK